MPERPDFREWVDSKPDPGWPLLPLTHITKCLLARDIIREGKLSPTDCEVFGRKLAYFFYGRPAYRVSGDGAIRQEAACPFCFVFSPGLIHRSHLIHAFDTGAHAKRMFSPLMLDEIQVADYSLEKDTARPNKLIAATFGSQRAYYDGDVRKIPSKDEICGRSDLLVSTYIDLIKSEGRNEPDDRVCTIEITCGDPVLIEGGLDFVVVPDTFWSDSEKASWLKPLSDTGVEVLTYRFLPGRNPDYYNYQIEEILRDRIGL